MYVFSLFISLKDVLSQRILIKNMLKKNVKMETLSVFRRFWVNSTPVLWRNIELVKQFYCIIESLLVFSWKSLC